MAEQQTPVVVGRRLFVGNLPWSCSWQDLKDAFRQSGNVVYSNVMRDEEGRSKGWGIVEYETTEEAVQAIATLNGTDLAGRRVLVREDREDRDIKPVGEDGEAGTGTGGRARRGGGGRGRRGGGAQGAGGANQAGDGNQTNVEGQAPRQPREPRERRPRGGRGGGRGERTGESSGLQIVVQGIPWSYTGVELGNMFADVAEVVAAEVATGYDGRSRGFGTVRFNTVEDANQAVSKFHESELEGRTLAVFTDKFA